MPALKRALVVVALLVAGIIHLLPLPGLFGAAALERLYGIRVDDPALLLLLRHRALLFGLLGASLIGAIFRPGWRSLAVLAGLVSTAGFLLLAAGGDHGAPIQRVILADVIASVLLVAAAPFVLRRAQVSDEVDDHASGR